MQVMLMRLMSKGEYVIVPKGTKFTGSGKLGLIYACASDQNELPFCCTVVANYSKSSLKIMKFSFLHHLQNPAD